ncbi:MAG: hypothetical protein R2834_01980 [Rhodothermales bacterium]
MRPGLFLAACFLLCALPVRAQTLLVGEKDGGRLAFVDPATLAILARVPANSHPHEVATDGRYAYVSNSGANAITVIDIAARAQAPGIALGGLGACHGLWMAGGKLYFASENARTIGRYDPATREIDWVLGTGLPRSHMLVLSADASTLFTANMRPGSAGIIERPLGADGKPGDWTITEIPTGRRAEGIDLSPDGRTLWVANVDERTISVIDVASKSVVRTLQPPTTFSNRLKFTRDGRRVLVADLQGDHVVLYDAATYDIVRRIDVGGGSEGLLMTPDGRRAFVAVSPEDKVVAIDLETLDIVGVITGLENPDGMAWVESLEIAK